MKLKRTSTEIVNDFRQELREIAEACEEEGYPSHGSNYELRTAGLWDEWYDEEYLRAVCREKTYRHKVKTTCWH